MHALVAPRAEDKATVRAFLAEHGVADVVEASPNGDWLRATTTVAVAEAMLGRDAGDRYRVFEHAASGTRAYRLAGGYALPRAVAAAVDLVAPAARLPAVSRGVSKGFRGPGGPDGLFNTPKSLRALYSVPDAAIGKQAPAFRQAVTAFIGQGYSATDLEAFYKYLCVNQTFTCGIDNKPNMVALHGDKPKGDGIEAMLDIEYITSTGAGVNTEFWGFSGHNPYAKQQEPFMKWLTLVSNTSDATVPKLFSTSYGEDESEIPQNWAERTNREFQKAGARGISLLFASGDSGAAGDNGCTGKNNDIFVPQWPSGSPYVTAVGGTSPGLANKKESAAGLSSGGFSNRWARPSYQKAAVADYLKNAKNLPKSSSYNATGNGLPDISAAAENFIVVVLGIPMPGVSGTSCASPTASGIFGLINDARAQAGKSALGFLNPFIYANAAAFNDVTSGASNGCGFSAGWPASSGWDAATGMGSPNYEKLSAAALALP